MLVAKSVKAEEVEQVVRRYLQKKDYSLSEPKEYGQTGADITATRGRSTLFIEVIGFQDKPPTRSREFYECFFRVLSRERNNRSDTLVMALPYRFKNGMRQRRQQYAVAWEKLGKAFPNLKIWYVKTHAPECEVEECSWAEPFHLTPIIAGSP